MDYPFAERLGELAREHGRRALGARAALRLHGPRRAERPQVLVGGRRARPERRHRGRERRRGRGLPPRLPARALRGRTRSTRSSSSSGRSASASRRRTAPCPSASRSWAACATSARSTTSSRSRAAPSWVRPVLDFAHMHATSDGAFVERGAVRGRARRRRRGPRAGRAVPHPLLRHRVREPERDEAPALRRGNAARRAARARRSTRFERPATVISESPDERVESGDPRGARGRRRELGEPHLVGDRVVRAPAVAEEAARTARAARSRAPGTRSRGRARAPTGRAPRPRDRDPAPRGRPRAPSSTATEHGRVVRRRRSPAPRARGARPRRPCRRRRAISASAAW